MSVLIRGMKMPKSCTECRFAFDGRCLANWGRKSKIDVTNYCPLVELKPHGRLIDADAFEADRRKNYCEDCERRKGKKNGKWTFVYEIGGVACLPCGIEDVLDDLEDAPTIIEEDV